MSSPHWLSRTELLLGSEKLQKLQNAHVLIVGLGGVGGYAAEQICRAGVGKMTIVDGDDVSISNINRQIAALNSNINKAKADVIGKRLLDINQNLELKIVNTFLKDQNMIDLLETHFDYVVDAIDTLSPKVYLIYHSLQKKYRVISSLGAGGKLDPSQVQVSDISKSYGCPLGRMLRKRLSKLKIKSGFDVVFSPEKVDDNAIKFVEEQNKKTTVGTISYMPPIFGIMCASKVINSLISD